MTTVAMDTSALMAPVECDVRVFEELDRLLGSYEPVVPVAVRDELETLSAGAGEAATAASVGADLADERCRVLGTDAGYADDALVELAVDGRCDRVVTNDGPLRERISEQGIRAIGVRGRNKLETYD